MPLDVARLLESDTYALATGDEFKAALTLWARSWLQVPAGSIPADDRILAKWAGVSLAEWRELRPIALRGWSRCTDARLYHPVVAEKALTAWLQRLSLQERSAKANDRPGRAFTYDPAQFKRLRADAEEHLAAVREMISPGPDMADSPTGTGDCSDGEEQSGPTANDNRSEVEAEVEEEAGGRLISPAIADSGSAAPGKVQEAFDAYNEAAERLGLPRALLLTDKRQREIRARLKEAGMAGWRQALDALALSPHHLGQNDRGWRADLDFVIRPDRFQRFLEGATIPTERRHGAAARPGSTYVDLAASALPFREPPPHCQLGEPE